VLNSKYCHDCHDIRKEHINWSENDDRNDCSKIATATTERVCAETCYKYYDFKRIHEHYNPEYYRPTKFSIKITVRVNVHSLSVLTLKRLLTSVSHYGLYNLWLYKKLIRR